MRCETCGLNVPHTDFETIHNKIVHTKCKPKKEISVDEWMRIEYIIKGNMPVRKRKKK